MATYILLLTLTPEGRASAVSDPDYLLPIESAIDVTGVTTLGLYAVLGQYDYVTILEAPGNAEAAQFSLELGVRANVHVTTMPVIPASSLEDKINFRQARVELALQDPEGRSAVS